MNKYCVLCPLTLVCSTIKLLKHDSVVELKRGGGKKGKERKEEKKKEKELWATPPSKAWSDTKLSTGEESNPAARWLLLDFLDLGTTFVCFYS